MHDELRKIMSFFSLDPKEKSEHLEEVFQDSIEFFEKFKDVLEKGTPEEKEKMLGEVMMLQEKLQQETQRMCEETGLSESELKDYAQNKENFSDEEWKSIQSARHKLENQAEEISSAMPEKKQKEPSKEKKAPSSSKKSKWMKS